MPPPSAYDSKKANVNNSKESSFLAGLMSILQHQLAPIEKNWLNPTFHLNP